MKVIYNKIIPLKGYKCINLFGVLFVRKGCTCVKAIIITKRFIQNK